MKLSPIYKARLDEAKQEGLSEGIQQEATLVVRLLKRKIAELSPNLESKIMGLPINVLEDLGEALLDFNSVDDLINWLNNHE